MKKVLVILAVISIAALSAFAVPTAQVTAATAVNLFFVDSGFTTGTTAGWYTELILQSANTAYNPDNFALYVIAVETPGSGFYNPAETYHETGKNAIGGAISSTRSQIKWQFTETTYDNYYASFRVYNNIDKTKASKYLVLPTWKQVTVDPAAVLANQNLSWTVATTDRAYMKYDVPAVPEPATMALFGLGGLALVIRRKIRKEA